MLRPFNKIGLTAFSGMIGWREFDGCFVVFFQWLTFFFFKEMFIFCQTQITCILTVSAEDFYTASIYNNYICNNFPKTFSPLKKLSQHSNMILHCFSSINFLPEILQNGQTYCKIQALFNIWGCGLCWKCILSRSFFTAESFFSQG